MARADSRKANKEKAAKTQKEILAALKKSFSLDNDIVKYITKLYSPTELKKSFDAGKSATTKREQQELKHLQNLTSWLLS